MIDIVKTKLKNVIRRARTFLKKEVESFQLELFLPAEKRRKIIYAVSDNFNLRVLSNNDQAGIVELMSLVGFEGWDFNILESTLWLCVPEGCFVLVDKSSNKIAATMMARHLSDDLHPYGGRIDWLAVRPEYRGKGLGYVVASAATNRLIDIGYKNIYVTTDDHRLAAIKTFLKIGYVPNLYRSEMHGRWEKICSKLNLPFQPEYWNKFKNDLMEQE